MFFANLIITFSGAVQNWNKKASDHEIGQTFWRQLQGKLGYVLLNIFFSWLFLIKLSPTKTIFSYFFYFAQNSFITT